MNLHIVVILAACLSICIAPASSTGLLTAAAAVKGAILGAGLTALKGVGGSETVIIQSQPGSVAEVVPASQITVQDFGYRPAQTITYTSGNPISRLWGAVSNAISAKTKAIGDLFRPNRVVIVVPEKTTTTTTTTPKPTPIITLDLGHKPLPVINIESGNKPSPIIDIELGNKPLLLPGINVELGNKPLLLPGINVELDNKPLYLPGIDIELGNKPLLPGIDIELNANLPVLPSIGVSASVGRNSMFRRIQPVLINYLKK